MPNALDSADATRPPGQLQDRAGVLKSVAAGALAGAAATVIMSPLMAPRLARRIARMLPAVHTLDEFPPRRIIQVTEEHVTGRQPLPDTVETAVTWPAHLAYGMCMGALYGALRSSSPTCKPTGMPEPAAGVLFGLGVWAAGYAGWLPVFGVREGTVRGDPADLPFPFAAHVVYGATLGALHGRMR